MADNTFSVNKRPRAYRVLKCALLGPFSMIREAAIDELKKAAWSTKTKTQCAEYLGFSYHTLNRLIKEFPDVWETAIKGKPGKRVRLPKV